MKNLYGVFAGTKFGMTTNKRKALTEAKKRGGFVTRMDYPHDTHAWDAPTFYACSDVIADYPAEES